MKTKSLRIGKRSLAMILSLMMIVSSVFVGSLNGNAVTVDVENSEAKLDVEASGESRTFSGTERLYFKMSDVTWKGSNSSGTMNWNS